MSPREQWNDQRIDDLARRHEKRLDDIDERLDGFSAGKRLTTVQIAGLILGFLGPIVVAIITAMALVLTKGAP